MIDIQHWKHIMTIPKIAWRLRIPQSTLVALATILLQQSASPGAERDAIEPAGLESKRVRIAIVQQETKPGDVEANRAKAIRFAREALSNDADVILFHEALLVGYVPNIHDLAEPVDSPSTQAFNSFCGVRRR